MRLSRLLLAFVGAGLVATGADAQEPTGTLKKIKDTGTITIGHRESSVPFSYLDEKQQPVGYAMELCGKVVDADSGAVLAEHEGVHGFTIGQRKGLGIAGPGPDGRPRYVTEIDPDSGTVPPSDKVIAQHRAALERAFGGDAAAFDAEWSRWVLRTYRRK